MLLTLTLEGVTRNFHVEEGDIHMGSWNEIIIDMLDSVQKSRDPNF